MKRKLPAAAIAMLLVVSAVVVGAVMISGGPVSGSVALTAPDGPSVTLEGSTDANLTAPIPDDHTVNWNTSAGNASFSSSSRTNVTVGKDDLTGTWTNVSAVDADQTALTVNPEDKPAVTLTGGVDSFGYRSTIQEDDGTVDFVYSSSAPPNITLRGLTASTQFGAVDGAGNLLEVAASDSAGTVTFDSLPSGDRDIRITTNNDAPSATNLEPSGDLTNEPTELEADISDPDFGNSDSVTVTFRLDGSQIDQQTISSNQTVNTTIPGSGQTGGSHEWEIEVEDSFGESTTESASYRAPATLYVRNESNPNELIDSPTTVTIRLFGDDGTIHTRTTDDGTVDMTGLAVNQQFIVEVEASDSYHSRTVRVDSIYQQEDIYLLPTNVTSVESRFTLNDPTGQFDSETILYIDKAINQSGTVEFRTIHADRFGVEGVTATLEEGSRYRVRIESDQGTVQDIGPFRADASETVTVSPGSPTIEIGSYEDGWGTAATLVNTTLEWRYSDPEQETDSLTIWIHEKGDKNNQLRPNQTFTDLGNASAKYSLDENEKNTTWVVNYVVDRGGEEYVVKEEVANTPDLVPGLSREWRLIVGVGLMLISAGAFSVLNAGIGGVVVSIEGGILWWTGWLTGATTGIAVVMSLFIALIVHIYSTTR